MQILLLAALLACNGCGDVSGSAHAGGSDYGSAGRVRLGVPF